MKKYLNIVIAVALIALIFYIFSKVSEAARNKERLNCTQKEIIVTNEVVKIKEVVRKRKAIAKSASPSANLEWLQEHACTDCTNR